ncbi:MAG: patatin-like phospholipase family protein [Candidatus Omnitrophota bacterium]
MNFMSSKPKKVALVMGGGGARGLAHVGILKVLEREEIKVDIVIGTSMGAAIGAAYCLGNNISQIEKKATTISWTDLFDPTIPTLGLIEGTKLENVLRELLDSKTFLDTTTPLAVVTTDIEKAEEVVYTSGDLVRTVRASCSWPGIFNPVKIDGRLLVDGGIMNSVPVAIAKKLGADLVVACDVGFCVTKDVELNNILKLMLQSFQIMGEELNTYQAKQADIIIEPDLANIDQTAFDRSSEIIHKGQEAAEKMLPMLQKKLCIKKRRFKFRKR